jgi:hypothetical protein
MYLINLGLPPWICIIAVLMVGIGVGLVNGLVKFSTSGAGLNINSRCWLRCDWLSASLNDYWL